MVQSLAIPLKNFLKAPGRSGNSIEVGKSMADHVRENTTCGRLTEPEHTLIRHLPPASDHVSHMALGELVVTQVDRGHPFLFQRSHNLADFLRPGFRRDGCGRRRRVEEERGDDVRFVVRRISVRELGRCSRVDDRMQSVETVPRKRRKRWISTSLPLQPPSTTHDPGCSGTLILIRTSRLSPNSARSATNLSRPKFILAPETTATNFLRAPTRLLRTI